MGQSDGENCFRGISVLGPEADPLVSGRTHRASTSAEGEAPPSAAPAPTAGGGKKVKPKTEKEVQAEIREIMKQITSSVTFLPMLDEPCASPSLLAST